MLQSEIEKAILDGERKAGDVPEQALDVIEGFNLIQERSQGVFSYSIKDLTPYTIDIVLNLKRADGDRESHVKVDTDGKVQLGNYDYAGAKIRVMQGEGSSRRKSHS